MSTAKMAVQTNPVMIALRCSRRMRYVRHLPHDEFSCVPGNRGSSIAMRWLFSRDVKRAESYSVYFLDFPDKEINEVGFALLLHRLGIKIRLMFEKRMLSRVPVIKLLAGENVRQGFIGVAEMSALLEKVADPDARDINEFLYGSGWRSSEAKNLRWNWLDGNMIRLPAEYSKNKKARVLPIIGTIKDVIERRQGKRMLNCEFVFHRSGRQIKHFRKGFKAAAKEIGCEGRLPHDMRRSAVRNFRRSGLSEHEGMALSGHLTAAVYRRYDIIAEEDLAESMKRVAEHMKIEQEKQKIVPINKRTA